MKIHFFMNGPKKGVTQHTWHLKLSDTYLYAYILLLSADILVRRKKIRGWWCLMTDWSGHITKHTMNAPNHNMNIRTNNKEMRVTKRATFPWRRPEILL